MQQTTTVLSKNEMVTILVKGHIQEWNEYRKAHSGNIDLHKTNLTGANLTGANLTGANLTRADLYGANLTGANLAGAGLCGVNYIYATMSHAQLALFEEANRKTLRFID